MLKSWQERETQNPNLGEEHKPAHTIPEPTPTPIAKSLIAFTFIADIMLASWVVSLCNTNSQTYQLELLFTITCTVYSIITCTSSETTLLVGDTKVDGVKRI